MNLSRRENSVTLRLNGTFFFVICCLLPLGCREESKDRDTTSDTDTPAVADSDVDTSPSEVVDWNRDRRDFCGELNEKFLACDLLSAGTFGCTGPSNARGACLYDCIAASPCDQLSDYVCGLFTESPLEACADDCYDAEAFTCENGAARILASWQCDGEADCSDGSDEADCTDFQCTSGETIPEARRCDAAEHCLDGSDEQACPNFITCGDGETIPNTWKCDYFQDCSDGADEQDCEGFHCDSGETVDKMWVCDYEGDCADGSDEVGCTGFRCDNGQIIAEAWACDLYTDCEDGSDEENCSGFECVDGYVIPASWECDNQADCADGSDEHSGCAQVQCPVRAQ